MTDREESQATDRFARIRQKEGLLAAAVFAQKTASRFLQSGTLSGAVPLIKFLVATVRRELISEDPQIRGKILRKVFEALSEWQCAAPEFKEELYYMWIVFYNTTADSSKEQSDYPSALDSLKKAEKLIREAGYRQDLDLLIGIAYTKVNLSTLSLAVQRFDQALVYAEESIRMIGGYLPLERLRGDAERYDAVVNSYVLAYFNKAVAEEFLGDTPQSLRTYQDCLNLATRHNYRDPFLLEEAKYALNDLQQKGTLKPLATSAVPTKTKEGYYSETALQRLATYLQKDSSPFFISVGEYYHAKILRELQLEKDVTHMPVYTQCGLGRSLQRKFSLIQSQDRRALSTLRLRKSHVSQDRSASVNRGKDFVSSRLHQLSSAGERRSAQLPILRKSAVRSRRKRPDKGAGAERRFERTQANEEIEAQLRELRSLLKTPSPVLRKSEGRMAVSDLAMSARKAL